MLSLSSQQRGAFTVVKVSGNLDLSEVTFMDTGCLAVIMGHYKRLSAPGGLILAGARYRPAKALWITGLARQLPLYDSVDAAIAAGEEPSASQEAPASS